MALISGGSKGVVKPSSESSTMKNTPVGTGSRPVPSRNKIETSAHENARTLGRDVPGSLK
jgi:hypothetical protein